MIYVFLDSSERQIERIRLRVAKGGHPVPDDKVRERRERSFDQLAWFFRNSDYARVYDNSGSEPKLVARRDGAIGILSDEMLPELRSRFDLEV